MICEYFDKKDGTCTNIKDCKHKKYEFGANEDCDYAFCDKEGEEE